MGVLSDGYRPKYGNMDLTCNGIGQVVSIYLNYDIKRVEGVALCELENLYLADI